MGKDLQNTDMFSGHLARGRFDIVINIALSDSRFHKLKNSNYLKFGVFPAPWVAIWLLRHKIECLEGRLPLKTVSLFCFI